MPKSLSVNILLVLIRQKRSKTTHEKAVTNLTPALIHTIQGATLSIYLCKYSMETLLALTHTCHRQKINQGTKQLTRAQLNLSLTAR